MAQHRHDRRRARSLGADGHVARTVSCFEAHDRNVQRDRARLGWADRQADHEGTAAVSDGDAGCVRCRAEGGTARGSALGLLRLARWAGEADE